MREYLVRNITLQKIWLKIFDVDFKNLILWFTFQGWEGVGWRHPRAGAVRREVLSAAAGGRASAHQELAAADPHPRQTGWKAEREAQAIIHPCIAAQSWQRYNRHRHGSFRLYEHNTSPFRSVSEFSRSVEHNLASLSNCPQKRVLDQQYLTKRWYF